MTYVRPCRRTTWEPGWFFSDRSELRTFMIVLPCGPPTGEWRAQMTTIVRSALFPGGLAALLDRAPTLLGVDPALGRRPAGLRRAARGRRDDGPGHELLEAYAGGLAIAVLRP